MNLLAPTVIGPYAVGRALGSGGMGEVYRARDSRLDRDVALKILSPEFSHRTSAVARFAKEAKAVAALSHPNIITIYDYGFENGTFFIAMELLEGETLHAHIASGLPWRRAVEIASSVADALRCAHEHGIIHRDLKPENVFITSGGIVKVLDFGLARNSESHGDTSDTLTAPGSVVGTAGYMAPEQVRGERVGPQTDVFAFGCVLYEMLSSRRAFGGHTVAETMSAVLRDEPAGLRKISGDIPEQLVRLVERCLRKEPLDRHQSFGDVQIALANVATSQSSALHTATTRLRAAGSTMSAVILVALLAVTIYVGRPVATDRPQETVSQPLATDLQARKLYAEGRLQWDQRTPESLLRAIDSFQRAVEVDSSYAEAYLGIAECYMLLGGTYEYMRPRDAMPKAEVAARRALTLSDDKLAHAHAALGNIQHEYYRDWRTAESEYRKAIASDPRDAVAHQWYGQALVLRGRHAEGLKQLELSEDLNPVLLVAKTDLVQAAWIAGDYVQAISRARRVLEIVPQFWLAQWLIGMAQLSNGDVEQAIGSIEHAVELGGTPATRGSLAAAYAYGGRRDDALRVLAELETMRQSGGQYVSPAGFVVGWTALGDLDRAYEEAERGLEERTSLATSLNTAPILEPFRRDPRYPAFARRVGLPPLP